MATVDDFFVCYYHHAAKLPSNVVVVAYMQVESEDYRVFFLNSYTGPAKKIICEVGTILSTQLAI